MHTPKSLLVAVCLVCLTPLVVAADGEADGEVMEAEARHVTNDEKGKLLWVIFIMLIMLCYLYSLSLS